MASATLPSEDKPLIGARIFDLPEEIQKEICSHCSQCDLICLSLVCSRFRALAAAQLYRNFHIVFPDEDDPCFDSPIDGLAGGLDTFVTSDYNYAQHLRDLSLDTLSAGDKGEAAYRPYLSSLSCGKFLNTLLLLTLRRAKSLDTFRWNIRVELSRPVYKELHSIKSLRHLHIRLQSGPSLYELPPPLPFQYHSTALPPAPSQTASWNSPAISIFGAGPLFPPPPSIYKPSPKPRSPKRTTANKEPLTISGFKGLQSLVVLDIDDLDIFTEIKTCVRESSSTLRKLKLSLSDPLASQARKPSLDPEIDESDADDEFQIVPLPTTVNYESSGPARTFRAQQERKAQESVLGRVFDIEPSPARKNEQSTETEEEHQQDAKTNDGRQFMDAIEQVSQRLIKKAHGTSDLSNLDQQEMLDTIVKAAKKYMASETPQPDQDKAEVTTLAASTGDGVPGSTSGDSADDKIATPATEETQSTQTAGFTFGNKAAASEDESRPEDIDIALPLEPSAIESREEANNDENTAEASPSKTPIGSEEGINVADEDASARIEKAAQSADVANRDMVGMRHEMNVVEAEMEDASEPPAPTEDRKDESRRLVSEYAKGTRGIGLRSLGIHLIPIKASVLGRAIDLHMLKRITLLNVGAQAPFWTLMMKEHKLQPLQLRKVSTDNACLQFLQLVSELGRVDEVFMLERSAKYKPESFAPKSKTTIEQIRKFVLRKHMPSLKRLMIRNETDTSWDVDEKTTQLICRRGKVLEELAVIMGMRAVHSFIQYLPGLVNLRALHLISFRSNDACLSVMRETRRFIVDTISHYPTLKLEWLSMGTMGAEDDRAVRIVRKPDAPKKKKSKKDSRTKGNGGNSPDPGYPATSAFPALPVDEWDDSDSDEDEEDDVDSFPVSKLELVENVAFYDIWGIRVFKKEVMAGCL